MFLPSDFRFWIRQPGCSFPYTEEQNSSFSTHQNDAFSSSVPNRENGPGLGFETATLLHHPFSPLISLHFSSEFERYMHFLFRALRMLLSHFPILRLRDLWRKPGRDGTSRRVIVIRFSQSQTRAPINAFQYGFETGVCEQTIGIGHEVHGKQNLLHPFISSILSKSTHLFGRYHLCLKNTVRTEEPRITSV